MNVLLLSANTLQTPYPVYPIGLDYVAGAIDDRHQVRIVDLLTCSLERLAGIIADFAPEIIGISIRNIDNTDAADPACYLDDHRRLVAWLRQRSRAVLVCGGSGFTIMPTEIMAMLGVDYGLAGEGERFALLVEALAEGRSPDTIPGLLKADGGHDSSTPAGPPPVYPGSPSRRLPASADHAGYYLERGGMLNLQSKRGCAFRCLYCPYPGIEGGRHRPEEPEKVAETAVRLREAGARYLFFTDSAFNSDIGHSLAVARALSRAGLDIPWGAFFAPTALPEGYFRAMAESGCRHVEFGSESLSDAMLAAYRKPFRRADVFRAHRQALEARLRVAHYFLLGGPGESLATAGETLDGLAELQRAVFFLFVGIRIYPGTGLHRIALAEGQIDAKTDLLRPTFYRPEAVELETLEELVRQRAAGRRNWVTGSGGCDSAAVVQSLHQRGLSGPLWEFLSD